MLEARPALKGVQILDGPPSKPQESVKELIELGDIDFEQSPAGHNPATLPRNEVYWQRVEISVVQATRSDQRSSLARAFELLAEIETALRTDPDLSANYAGSGFLVAAQVEDGTVEKRASSTARSSVVSARIRVHARI